MLRSASAQTEPPRPPSPPSGPPAATYFSRWKPTLPSPPLPDTILIFAISINMVVLLSTHDENSTLKNLFGTILPSITNKIPDEVWDNKIPVCLQTATTWQIFRTENRAIGSPQRIAPPAQSFNRGTPCRNKTSSFAGCFVTPPQPHWDAARPRSRARIASSAVRVSNFGFARNRNLNIGGF